MEAPAGSPLPGTTGSKPVKATNTAPATQVWDQVYALSLEILARGLGKLATSSLNCHNMIPKLHLLALMEILLVRIQITPSLKEHLHLQCPCISF